MECVLNRPSNHLDLTYFVLVRCLVDWCLPGATLKRLNCWSDDCWSEGGTPMVLVEMVVEMVRG